MYFGQCKERRKSSADIFICADIFDFYTASQIHDCSHHLFIYMDGDVQSRLEIRVFTTHRCDLLCILCSEEGIVNAVMLDHAAPASLLLC